MMTTTEMRSELQHLSSEREMLDGQMNKVVSKIRQFVDELVFIHTNEYSDIIGTNGIVMEPFITKASTVIGDRDSYQRLPAGAKFYVQSVVLGPDYEPQFRCTFSTRGKTGQYVTRYFTIKPETLFQVCEFHSVLPEND